MSEIGLNADGLERLLVKADELAIMLGVSVKTVWNLEKRGELPHVNIGRRVLFPVDEMRRWISERTIKAKCLETVVSEKEHEKLHDFPENL
ncbi:MAG: helix-turn-helix domain-containing protein [Planctomycetaceae bacterium]|nr:helix-turn-helix domain-containing protein [Planctomycetaceae bacterium]